MSECEYRNCSEHAQGRFCSTRCRRWYERENVNERRKVLLEVVTPYWKTAKELYQASRLAGYEGHEIQHSNDLLLLAQKRRIERRIVHHPEHRGGYFAEYRKVNS